MTKSEDSELLISVCSITYNHEEYIEQMIQSILDQKCTYRFELIIGEDCSTDNTRAILKKYAASYPNIIKLLLPEKNIGAKKNFMNTLLACKGKYIAICEGDDYWTDPYKLQKQADFMEANPDCSLCFTEVDILESSPSEYHDEFPRPNKNEFDIRDIIETSKNFIPTATLFFRNVLPNPLPYFFQQAMSGDIALHLLLADKGKIKFIDAKTAVYRLHEGGISKTKEHLEKHAKNLLLTYIRAHEYFKYKYSFFDDRILVLLKSNLIYGSRHLKGRKKLNHAIEAFQLYFKHAPEFNLKETAYLFTLLFLPALLKPFQKTGK